MNPNLIVIITLGTTLLLLLTFQVLVGLRIIHFRGRTHLRVHRTNAFVILTIAAVHAIIALGTFVFGWF